MTLEEFLMLHERLCGDWSNAIADSGRPPGEGRKWWVKRTPEGDAWLRDEARWTVAREWFEAKANPERIDVDLKVRERWRKEGPDEGLEPLLEAVRRAKRRTADEEAG